ncbi:hypothetical protein MCOR27_009130 [Pyricularia oryzae]|uniref:Uncharacterized protein n=2 Tax=Pyricularia TaxID=48558 RepID=A0ABQ8NHE8_PYRGI|nr:hypothetical protein MCOR01_003834 [Pyricularia oryzae]KAI6297161.1 hypothetical protein MCOR33_006450 [Pyricularia grisea]KAH9427358.1 hypothetical protein MCOR02_012264 [Pyricularia oryzae]KAI6255858.1 hypothetical protein MCOR19_007661 [Pyricularia oryzae]KAI6270770.1 hypothetical protein MCOR27_009130 [Pyricularia oryzae]
MFHSQGQMANPLGLMSLKRGRDDEATESCQIGFTEHRNKRFQTLPLRTASRPNFDPDTTFSSPESLAVKPHNFESENGSAFLGSCYAQQAAYAQQQQEQAQPSFSPWSSTSSSAMGQEYSHGGNADMDMMMDSDCGGDNQNGRMPTPILPSFAAQVKGSNWGAAGGNGFQSQAYDRADGFSSSPVMSPTAVRDRTVPRSLEHSSATMADWNLVQNRPLPSPISESGGEEMSSPNMVLDCQGSFPYMAQRSSSATELPMYLRSDSPTAPSSPPQEHPNLHQYQQVHQQREGSPSPSKKGHTRSRHTVNNWTLHGGMKKSFSIGYRADCEKCRLKVPGHFNHIIVS